MSDFPILKWVNVDGRSVPFTYPQHKKDGGYVETGDENPLPVGNHVMSEGGLWIPEPEVRSTQLTGSNVENELTKTLPPNAVLMGISDGEKIQAVSGATEFPLLARGVRDAPIGTAYQNNVSSRGVLLFLRIYDKPENGDLTLQFTAYDKNIANTKPLVSISGINQPRTIAVTIYPGIPESTVANSLYNRNFAIPKTWMTYIAITGGDWDFSLSGQYLI